MKSWKIFVRQIAGAMGWPGGKQVSNDGYYYFALIEVGGKGSLSRCDQRQTRSIRVERQTLTRSCMRILARRQPGGRDPALVMCIPRSLSICERIGDEPRRLPAPPAMGRRKAVARRFTSSLGTSATLVCARMVRMRGAFARIRQLIRRFWILHSEDSSRSGIQRARAREWSPTNDGRSRVPSAGTEPSLGYCVRWSGSVTNARMWLSSDLFWVQGYRRADTLV